MKRLIFIIALFCGLSVFAQDTHRVYCELLGIQKGIFSRKVKITVDFGQEVSFWKKYQDTKLVDEEGQELVFNSMVDGMNFMGTLGWNFQQAYVVTESGQNVYHWLLYKDIKEGEDIMEGFLTKGVFKAANPTFSYNIQFLKKKVSAREWDLVKEYTKTLSQEELNKVIKEWEDQTTEQTEYKCSVKKAK